MILALMILIFAAAFTLNGQAQPTHTTALDAMSAQGSLTYMLKRLSLNEGLSQSTVQCVLRDSKGYLWLGTGHGLNRWINGEMVNYYATEDSMSIPHNDVYLLWEDAKEQVWMAGRGGVSVYDFYNDNFRPILTQDGRKINIRSYAMLDDGNQIIMGSYGKLYSYDINAEQLTELPIIGGSSNCYTRILLGSEDEWILSTWSDGIWYYYPSTGEAVRYPNIKELDISATLIDNEGRLWVSVYGEGLRCYNPDGTLFFDTGTSYDGVDCSMIIELAEYENELWLATDGSGLKVMDKVNMKIRPIEADYDYRLLSVITIYHDEFGNLYAGTERDGVVMIHASAIRTYPHTPGGLNNFIVTSLIHNLNTNITYFGVDGAGIYRSDVKKGKLVQYPETDGMKVTSMIDLGDKTLLFATFDKGIFKLNVATGRLSTAGAPFDEIVHLTSKKGVIYEMAHLGENRIAIITDSLYVCDLVTRQYSVIKNMPHRNPSDHMRPIGVREGNLWLTGKDEILRMPFGSNTLHSIYKVKSPDAINDACINSSGILYVATNTGLYKVDISTMEEQQIEGLPQKVNTVLCDSIYLWIGANKTLWRKDLVNGSLREFSPYEGVWPNEFINRAKYVGKHFMLLGGVNGLLVADKDKLSEDAQKDWTFSNIPIRLAALKIDGQSFFDKVAKGYVRIPRSHSVVDLSIVELEPNPMRNKMFRFAIEGGGKSWTVDSPNRELQLNMLKSGTEYQVSASCSTIDGSWTEPIPILSIDVPRSLWFSWWAWILYALILLGMVSLWMWREAMIRARAQKQEEKDVLEKEVGALVNVNQELRTTLSLIYGPLRRMARKQQEQGGDEALATEMSQIAQHAESMRDVINQSMENESKDEKEQPTKAEHEQEIKEVAANYNTANLTMVIVDKDKTFANFIKTELQRRFKSVSVCTDVANAFIQIQNVKPDIIVSSNLEVCSKVKNETALKHIPVLYLSPSNSERQQEAAYRSGADSFIAKPFDVEVLESRCCNLLYTRSVWRERYQSVESNSLIKDAPKNNSDETFLLTINNIIQENMQNPDFSVNLIVDKMLMSRSAVYSRFKDLTGQSLGTYIIEYRLEKAKELLASKDLPINEVSDLLGFSNQRYFSTFFKAKTGLTPSQWRNRVPPSAS